VNTCSLQSYHCLIHLSGHSDDEGVDGHINLYESRLAQPEKDALIKMSPSASTDKESAPLPPAIKVSKANKASCLKIEFLSPLEARPIGRIAWDYAATLRDCAVLERDRGYIRQLFPRW
jgi:hypothetical protein